MCRRLIPFIIVVIFVLSSQLFSQEKDDKNVPGPALYLEMGGKFFGSFNIDFRINKSNRIGLGVSGVEPDIVPSVMYYHLGGRRSRFAIGGGLGFVVILDKEIERKKFKGVVAFGVIGYRYQKKNGFLFRAGFTPLIYSDVILPLVGISLGYSL